MAQIKRLSDNVAITVAQQPVWVAGIWECGDQRFTDPAQTLYAAVAAAKTYPSLAPMVFYIAFSSAERVAINNSLDKTVIEFSKTLQYALTTNTPVDPNRADIVAALNYLSTTNQNAATAAAWAQNTVVAAGATRAVGTSVYTCTTGGTTAASGTGPSGTGTAITDGTAVWSYTATPYIAASRIPQIQQGLPPTS